MPFQDGFELIKFAIDEEDEQKMYLRWVVAYQSSVSFAEFKNKVRQMSINDTRSSEEILASVELMMSNNLFKVENK